MKQIHCDVAIIGAGPAGLAAAKGAYDVGAKQILLIERDRDLGGILQQCIHNGFGVHLLGKDLTGPEYAEHFIDEVRKVPITCMANTMVLELSKNLRIQAAGGEGMLEINPKAVVLAMGCRERTRGAIAIPGQRPAGIMTAGTAQRFINIEGYLPGKKIVVVGSGDIGMIMARRLYLEGAQVKAVVEIARHVGGLSRNLVQCLRDFDIPLYLRHVVTEIRGHKRVEGIDIAPLDTNGKADISKAVSMDCDTLLLSVGLIPENELSRQAGILLDDVTGGPIVDQNFHTSVPGIFAAGNVVQVFDLVDHVSICGFRAGESAGRFFRGEIKAWDQSSAVIKAGHGVNCVIPQRLSGNKAQEISFYLRAKEVGRKVSLELRNDSHEPIFKKNFRIVRPPEMLTVKPANIEFSKARQYTFQIQGEA